MIGTTLSHYRIESELGRYREAIQWSQSVHESLQGFPPLLLPSTYLLEAAAHEALGEWDRAVERYGRLLHLWKDADAIMRPQIEEIVRRRGQALDRLADEG
jgi:tetratricopeptide (TPR) repeat protein